MSQREKPDVKRTGSFTKINPHLGTSATGRVASQQQQQGRQPPPLPSNIKESVSSAKVSHNVIETCVRSEFCIKSAGVPWFGASTCV